MNARALPPWVPDVDPPSALTAPRGMWLRQMEAAEAEAKARSNSLHATMQAGSRLSLPAGFAMRTFSDVGTYGRSAASAQSGPFGGVGLRRQSDAFLAEHLNAPLNAPLFRHGGNLGGAESDASTHGSTESLASTNTPRVSIVDEGGALDDDDMRLDEILQGLELNVAPTMQVSPVNFVDDMVLGLPTREFAQFLKTVDAQTASALKAARRRKKNREYAKGSRERRKERGGTVSPRDSFHESEDVKPSDHFASF